MTAAASRSARRPHMDFAAVNAAASARAIEILQRLLPGGRREGHEFVALNPRRDDRRPGSFKVSLRTGQWADFASGDRGGDFVSLLAFLRATSQRDAAIELAGMLGLQGFSTMDFQHNGRRPAENSNTRHEDKPRDDEVWRPILPVPDDAGKLTRELVDRCAPPGFGYSRNWPYIARDGRLLGHVVRYDRAANGTEAEKQIRPFTFCQGLHSEREWRCQGFPVPRPLYGLHTLALRPDAPVLVVEGEKTADAAAERFPGHVAVTSPSGSHSAGKADWTPLAGRHVTIWPDGDEPGRRYAAEVATLCRQAGAASARIVAVPETFPGGWDLADPNPEGVTDADLLRLLQGAEEANAAPEDGPLPLFPPLPPAEPYPVDALGPVLSRAARAIARKIQVPEATAAQSVLAVASLAAQALADVRLPFGQVRPLSLYLVTVAASGDRKTSADSEALWPARKREKMLREDYDSKIEAWRDDHDAWTSERKKIQNNKDLNREQKKKEFAKLGPEPRQPLYPILTASDPTIEGLLKMWVSAPASLGLFSAEGGQFTGGHAMNKDNRLKTAAALSRGWDGEPFDRVRAGDGLSLLYGRRLSLHLMIQPAAAAEFLSDEKLRDQGLLSRVLVAAPESLAGQRRYRDPTPEDDRDIRAYGARILSLLEVPWPLVEDRPNEIAPPVLSIAPDAEIVWRDFFDHVEEQSGPGLDLAPVGGFAAKAAEHAARIAGIITIVENSCATEIGATAMEGAVTVMDWYLNEQVRLHEAGRTDPKLLRADRLLRWMRERDEQAIGFSQIMQFAPRGLRMKAEAEDAISILMAHGWIVEVSSRPRQFRLAAGG